MSRWTSWAPVPYKPTVSVDVKQHFNNNYTTGTELRNCVKVEVAVLGSRPLQTYGFCGRKATLQQQLHYVQVQSSGTV